MILAGMPDINRSLLSSSSTRLLDPSMTGSVELNLTSFKFGLKLRKAFFVDFNDRLAVYAADHHKYTLNGPHRVLLE